ncbi:unnamed protein product [Arctogadus glacialis]
MTPRPLIGTSRVIIMTPDRYRRSAALCRRLSLQSERRDKSPLGLSELRLQGSAEQQSEEQPITALTLWRRGQGGSQSNASDELHSGLMNQSESSVCLKKSSSALSSSSVLCTLKHSGTSQGDKSLPTRGRDVLLRGQDELLHRDRDWTVPGEDRRNDLSFHSASSKVFTGRLFP